MLNDNKTITPEIEKLAKLISKAIDQPKITCLAEHCPECPIHTKCNMETRYAHFLIKNGVTFKKGANES